MKTARPMIIILLTLSSAVSCSSGRETSIAERLDEQIIPMIEKDLETFKVPGLSMAVVSGNRTIWKKGFGYQDRERRIPATPGTVYRVGSISKLFNAVAVMQQQEKGRLDIDADIRSYLPDMAFENPFNAAATITLRHLLCHRAGILRECPVGHYFDDSKPSLESTVRSMIGTPLIYPPGQKTKYSNIGIGIAGHILESATDTDFAVYQKKHVLMPIGMSSSGFLPEDVNPERIAVGYMRNLDGRQWRAPHFRFGHLSASNLYSTVNDLAEFMNFIFEEGKPILKPETFNSMLQVQFSDRKDDAGFGLGFFISKVHGFPSVGHGGAVYGFSADLLAIPEMKVGAVVLNNLDGANGINSKIINRALGIVLEIFTGKKYLNPSKHIDVASSEIQCYEGRYEKDGVPVWLTLKNDSLFFEPYGTRKQLRPLFKFDFITDDLMGYGDRIRIIIADNEVQGLEVNGVLYAKTPEPDYQDISTWAQCVGHYGPDYNVVHVYVKDGKLTALIEWFYEYPLEPVGNLRFKFPDSGLYMGEEIVFCGDKEIESAQVGPVMLFRRK